MKNSYRQCRRGRNESLSLHLHRDRRYVELASCNPYVPLDRQRERISDAQKQLIEDENRKLKEWEAPEEVRAFANGTSERRLISIWNRSFLNEEWERQIRDRDDGEREISNWIWGKR